MTEYQLFDTVFEPIIITNEHLEILYFNHSFVPYSHCSPRQIKQRQFLNNILESDDLNLSELLQQCKLKQTAIVGPESLIILKESNHPAYNGIVKITPLADGNYLFTINDMSVEKRLHEKYRQQLQELKESHQQIITADKLATLGELTAGISHEISNPLTIANGSCEIIEMCLESEDLNSDREQMEQSLNDIKEAHSRINSIIINMKSYLHQGGEQNEYFHLNEVVEKSITLVTPSFRDSAIQIEKENFDPSIVLYGNHVVFEQVLINLFKNALYAIRSAGTQHGKVTLSAAKTADGQIEIRVTDNGPGIDDEIAPSIFNTFFTTKDVGEGTGMGLSIAQKIINQHLGTIELDQSYKAGACFVIKLPALEVTQFTQDQMQVNNIASGSKKSKRVLIVDNEVQILNLFKTFFQDTRFHFYSAETTQAAFEQLKRVDIDLIITDLNMPGSSGQDLAAQLRQQGWKHPILYLSAKSQMPLYQADRDKLGIAGIIIKPFSRDEVIRTIEQCFEDSLC